MPRLRLLGSIELVDRDGTSIDRILAQPKTVALLAHLAAAGTGLHRRDRLVGLFWPDLDEHRARRNLRNRIHLLRKNLGDGAVIARGDDEIGLSSDEVECDVWAFEEAISRAAWTEALELYRGDLLEGFYFTGDGEYAHWLDGRREALRRMAGRAAQSASEEAEAAGQLPLAIRFARRFVTLSPANEIGLRRLLLLLDAAGDHAGVVGTYEAFRDRIAREYGLEPAPETVRLVTEILSRKESGPSVPLGSRGDLRRSGRGAGGVPQRDSSKPGHLPIGSDAETARRVAAPSGTLSSAGRIGTAVAGVTALSVAIGAAWLARRPPAPPLDPGSILVAFAPSPGPGGLADRANRRLREDLRSASLDVVPYLAADVGEAWDEPPDGRAPLRTLEPLGIGTVVTGGVRLDGSRLVADAELRQAPSGRILWSFSVDADESDDAGLLSELSQRVLGAVAVLIGDTPVSIAAIVGRTPRYDAFEHFAEGMTRYAGGDDVTAAERYLDAIDADPAFVLPRLEVATLAALGEGGVHRPASLAVLDALAEPPEEMSAVERMHLEWIPDTQWVERSGRLWLVGREQLETLSDLAPERYRSLWAYSELRAGNTEAAAEILATLDEDRNLVPNFDVVWPRVLHDLGRHEEALAFIDRHEEMRGNANIAFQSLGALGDTARVFALLEQRLEMRGPLGVVVGRVAAREMICHGHADAARSVLEWTAERIEPLVAGEAGGGGFHAGIAEVFLLLGDLDRLEELYDYWVRGGFDPEHPAVLEGRARLAALRGNRVDAQRLLERLRDAAPALVYRGAIREIEEILDPPSSASEGGHCVG